ncbi:ubiquinone biosynthesis protein COQ4 homolog, mitochondrial-like [Babylonia areolata]|uniref:ubiquinone biosynthesis protein COQ4 homolog, mitochondrial-like n=1 Tax=Babylonia areolata TaxID=304850 RepID=UPI003FD19F35
MATCLQARFLRRVIYSKGLKFHQYYNVAVPWHGLLASQRNLVSNVNQDFAQHEGDGEGQSAPRTYDQLYPGHIPTTAFQRGLLALGSALMCLYNPARDDMICALGETTGYYALRHVKDQMMSDPEGRLILQDQPLINTDTVDIKYLGGLPEGTFGKEYWKFLDKHGFSPDARLPVHFVEDPDLVYVMVRYRQVHDLTHTLLGMPPNMLGEVAVKWVEAIQTGLPMCGMAALFGPVRLGPKHRQKYLDIYLSWAIRCARNSKPLMTVYFEKHWEKGLDDLRKELNVEAAPVPLLRTGKGAL